MEIAKALLTLKHVGPVREGTVQLTPLHALIGPNDSGKTTVLRALQTLSHAAGIGLLADDVIGLASDAEMAVADPTQALTWTLRPMTSGSHERFQSGADDSGLRPLNGNRSAWIPGVPAAEPLKELLDSCRMLRLDPDEIRRPVGLLNDADPFDFSSPRGLGLGALLDALFGRRKDRFEELEAKFKRAFPSVAGFRFWTESSGRAIGVRLRSGAEIRPEKMSEGMLYFLAFSILPMLRPTAMLLVEEPENGLHPARIAEIIHVLRAISAETRVVIATHSPFVINELQPDEVTVVTRTEERGTVFTPIANTPNFRSRSKIYALGELWVSYANGIDEAPLFDKSSDGASSISGG
jgi:energy-coupling factor transporter ATP-binding protein EcfA2